MIPQEEYRQFAVIAARYDFGAAGVQCADRKFFLPDHAYFSLMERQTPCKKFISVADVSDDAPHERERHPTSIVAFRGLLRYAPG